MEDIAKLKEMIDYVRDGDTIYIHDFSRLARSTKQLCEIIETVKEKCLRLSIVGSICVDCSSGQIDPMTNAFIQISGVFAELELRIIRDRVRSGMANARAKGRKIGRPQITADDIPITVTFSDRPGTNSGKADISFLSATSFKVVNTSDAVYTKVVGIA